MRRLAREALSALALSAALAVALGLGYPLAAWLAAHAISPWRAEGSVVSVCGRPYASLLAYAYSEDSPLFRPLPPSNTTSGLDPFVPLEYALSQVGRVSAATGIPAEELVSILLKNAEENRAAGLYIFGPGYDVVNVVEVNLRVLSMLNRTCGG